MSRRASVVLLIVSLVIVSLIQRAARAEPRVELETFFGGGLGALGGGGRIGVPIGQHLVLMTGLEGQGSGGDQVTSYWVRIPAELKIYLARPRPGHLAPQLRLGAAYTRSGLEWSGGGSSDGSGVEGLGGLGLSYLVSEHFGLGADVGLTYGRYSQETSAIGFVGGGSIGEGWQLGLSWRLGLLFRI